MTQTEWVLDQLQSGHALTPLDALYGGGIFRLAARVMDLRKAGHIIDTLDRRLPNGKLVAEYHLRERELA